MRVLLLLTLCFSISASFAFSEYKEMAYKRPISTYYFQCDNGKRYTITMRDKDEQIQVSGQAIWKTTTPQAEVQKLCGE